MVYCPMTVRRYYYWKPGGFVVTEVISDFCDSHGYGCSLSSIDSTRTQQKNAMNKRSMLPHRCCS
jgi:hypothetical protein